MKIALIKPVIGARNGRSYHTPAVLTPLVAGLIAALTPPEVSLEFFDERLAKIDFSRHYDLVAITVETFSALRSYQIAHEFRRRGSKVLLGGFHPTLMPDEAALHADVVVTGTVEGVWPKIVSDLLAGQLAARYDNAAMHALPVTARRSIYNGKGYLPISLVETSRGCRFNCDFCSVHSFYGDIVVHRPIDEVVRELQSLSRRIVFFADDNIVSDPDHARKLFKAIKPLGLKWASQASITSAADPLFLDEMAASGCQAVIIGLESLRAGNLKVMNKSWSLNIGEVSQLLEAYRQRGIMVYATFVFGYPEDTPGLISETVEFAISRRLFMANFNMLYPFPGTPVYLQLQKSGRLLLDRWWLSPDFRWDFPAFRPEMMSPEELADSVKNARKRFNSLSSLFRRSLEFSANLSDPLKALLYLSTNLVSRADISRKSGLRPGLPGCAIAGERAL
ncbi:MAG: hypothetical protein CVV42_07925 [Candidatus Riflebacteria bacterium HGW-Riflebacteria-2]|nr:MAG: hypothetical protein CVV42_07925 [Candidatus Riflebacteria bacterium HGW-Riflebacteria-2]